eukprot:4604394-Pleurochrysis_carterae.AAC.8
MQVGRTQSTRLTATQRQKGPLKAESQLTFLSLCGVACVGAGEAAASSFRIAHQEEQEVCDAEKRRRRNGQPGCRSECVAQSISLKLRASDCVNR